MLEQPPPETMKKQTIAEDLIKETAQTAPDEPPKDASPLAGWCCIIG